MRTTEEKLMTKVKKVTGYQTSDGVVHQDLHNASRHQAKLELQEAVQHDDNFINGELTFIGVDELTDFLERHSGLVLSIMSWSYERGL